MYGKISATEGHLGCAEIAGEPDGAAAVGNSDAHEVGTGLGAIIRQIGSDGCWSVTPAG